MGQVLGGATFVGSSPILGAFTCYRTLATVLPVAQAAVGVQSVFTIPETGEHLQIVLSAQAALTDTGGLVTFDRSTGFGIQLQF